MFTRQSTDGKIAILLFYVDDIILIGDDITEMERLKQCLASEFEIKDLGSLKFFLEMEIARLKKGIVLSKRKYVLDLLKETGMSGCRPLETPIDLNQKLGDNKGDPMAVVLKINCDTDGGYNVDGQAYDNSDCGSDSGDYNGGGYESRGVTMVAVADQQLEIVVLVIAVGTRMDFEFFAEDCGRLAVAVNNFSFGT
ncbi:hypothetical protein RJ640_027090 [Escallonia rubra]|uniref:Reverse transcriptase Ty1/copia-type domain-containing protein n=1 Tax=Escallonia rubra TaxID=112253 RepID=A0AA88QU44_9ASTE|nr:hypothetical protein RJ640_027090 [Escallonia rubra]